jgi:hypothetical protein
MKSSVMTVVLLWRTMVVVNLTGCGEMSSYTFQITVIEEETRMASGLYERPMDANEIKDYLWAIIESRGTLAVLNIVRDY